MLLLPLLLLAVLDEPMASSIPPPNPTAMIRVDDLEGLAIRRNPVMGQAIERFEQARGRALQAGAYPNPLVIWSGGSLGDDGTAGTQQAFVQQPIVLGGKLELSRSVAEVEVEIARWNCRMQDLRIRNGVRLRALQVIAQQEMMAARAGLARWADQVAADTRAKVESGHAEEPDLLLARAEARMARLNLEQLHQRYQNSWRELAAYLGCPDMPPTRIDDRLASDAPEMEWDPLLAWLLAESPEIRVAELQVRRQAVALEREEAEPVPDLIVRGGTAHDPTDGQTTGYARIYLEVPLWDRNRGNIHSAHHRLAESRQDIDRVRLNLQQRLARAYNHYQSSRSNVRDYHEEILPDTLRAFELYREGFLAEETNYSRVESSRSAYTAAVIKYIEELLELRRSEVAIRGLLLYEETIEGGTLRPPGSGQLAPPGENLPNQPAGGGVPAGRPIR
jgi:cobalt-zinc-cadmium efflux system outer membrane protein